MRAKPNSCTGCPCYSHGTDFTAIEGTGSSGVMLVGEASGEHEQRQGTPFVSFAPAGAILERVLRRMGVDRQQLSVTNVLRCRPRNNWLENAPWEYPAINHCRENLDRALSDRRPRAIVALGATATRELTGMAGEAQGVGHLAGYALAGPNGTPVIPTFHPAFIRRGKASHTGVLARNIQRALNIARGSDREWLWNVDPEVDHERLGYNTHPTVGAAERFVQRVVDDGGTLSYDIETAESASLDEDARDGFSDTLVRLVQFSHEGRSIAIPFEREFVPAIQRALLSPNTKCGHNVWLFDNKVLAAAGAREGLDLTPRGVVHDTLAMFHHWQPDLPAHLQFAASFVQFPFPWKHLAGSHLAFYGCCDVDATLRLYTMLERTLRRDGLWGDDALGYLGQVYHVRPVLADMERLGLPIDDAARVRLGQEFERAQGELGRELSALAVGLGRVHPKDGYKGVPPEIKALCGPDKLFEIPEVMVAQFDDGDERYHYEQREFNVACVDEASGLPVCVPTRRWCRVYDFNPNSGPQLIAYMRAKGHPVPKSRKNEDADGNAKDTTEKRELIRLAHKTGDTFYLKTIEYREFGKAKGTYVDGFAPNPMTGCVHATFTFDTGTGQLAARNPNVTNFPKRARLAKQMRAMVSPGPGRLLVEWDYKSYHVLTTGFCAEDPDYMRLARLDMHSFVAGHALKCWDAGKIISEPDAALLDRFAWLKSDPDRKRVRDNQAKPTILGVGFGMGYRRLYQENLDHFASEREARKFWDLLRELFPRVFRWQERVKKQAHDEQRLVSPFGHIRRFYEVFRYDSRKRDWVSGDQAEEAVAFLPANIAFGNIRETMKEMARLCLDSRYSLCDNVHDSFLFNIATGNLDQHIADVHPVLTAPSRVLRHPSICPDGLVINVEGSAGRDWATMEPIAVGPCAPVTGL